MGLSFCVIRLCIGWYVGSFRLDVVLRIIINLIFFIFLSLAGFRYKLATAKLCGANKQNLEIARNTRCSPALTRYDND